MPRVSDGIPLTVLRDYGLYLSKKMGMLAAFWLAIYFISQLFAEGVATLFAMLIGALGGLVIGWVLAEDAVERAGFTGFPLWSILVLAGWLIIAIIESLMYALLGWEMTFGRWMLITAAMLMALASSVWRASADD